MRGRGRTSRKNEYAAGFTVCSRLLFASIEQLRFHARRLIGHTALMHKKLSLLLRVMMQRISECDAIFFGAQQNPTAVASWCSRLIEAYVMQAFSLSLTLRFRAGRPHTEPRSACNSSAIAGARMQKDAGQRSNNIAQQGLRRAARQVRYARGSGVGRTPQSD